MKHLMMFSSFSYLRIKVKVKDKVVPVIN